MVFEHLEVQESSEAVGLARDQGGHYVLKVPVGMGGMSDRPAQALGMLYRSFVVFRRTLREMRVLSPRDGVESLEKGAGATGAGLAYRDLLAFDELFDRVDPRSVLSLCERPARARHDLYRRIDRHLHHALYDADGVAYLESVPGGRRGLRSGRGDIVGLYCFLAQDFYQHLLQVDPRCAWGGFTDEGRALAADFQHRYLSAHDSLYAGDLAQRQRSLDHLREVLLRVDRHASPRDAHYRQLHDALERYLNAASAPDKSPGLVWGVEHFWAVWESVCLYHALAQSKSMAEHFHTCDLQHLPRGLYTPEQEKCWTQACQVFARNHLERRPDLVLNSGKSWKVVDFKYYQKPILKRPKWREGEVLKKQERDFISIETYGLLLNNHLLKQGRIEDRVCLEMWLPGRQAQTYKLRAKPEWDPPLTVCTLPTEALIRDYANLYQRSALA